MEKKKDQSIVVQSLIGGSQLSFYIKCLKSLAHFGEDHFDLHLHSDGSLSKKDEDFVHSELSGLSVKIVDSTNNVDRILDYLQCKPNSQKFRK